MEAAVENYKGIEFVRISTLPEDQRKMIWTSIAAQKIIKILRNKELLNDCLRYDDYLDWYENNYRTLVVSAPIHPLVQRAKELKLVFK